MQLIFEDYYKGAKLVIFIYFCGQYHKKEPIWT